MEKIIEFELNKNIEDDDKIREIEEKCKSGTPLDMLEAEALLRNLSYEVRKRIAEYEGKDMDDYSYSYKCDLAQSIICHYLDGLNIRTNPVNTNEVIDGVCGHSLLIANINTTEGDKTYLVDPTYIQFFDKENCDINKLIVLDNRVCISPAPGFFVVNGGNTELLMPLLTDGFIEFTEDVAKAYGDSFFQTKQGTDPDQIVNNVASGASYMKWFQQITSKLSKSEEELASMNLLIDSKNREGKHNHM